ncbi:MAG: hypothetical protein AB7S65_08155 [Sulfuricurvum sp.]
MSFEAIPSDYIMQLFDQGRREKAAAALEFFFFSEYGRYLSTNKWAKRWSVSKSTSWQWCEDFKAEEERRYRASMARSRSL